MFTFDGRDNGSSLRAIAQEKSLPATRPSITLGCSFIDPLDICIQTRFTQTNRGFGVERVLKPFHAPIPSLGYVYRQEKTMGMFVPENDPEKEVIAEIEQSDLKMALYLASRKVLGNLPDEPQDHHWVFHAPIRGPVGLTRNAQKIDWPEDLSLWKQAQKVMQDFDNDKAISHFEFSVGDKDFIARPVRAQEACLQCHTPQAYWGAGSNKSVTRQLSVGDPIGVLLYAYTKSTKSNNIKKP
jgi:hypothetical protein